MIKNIILKKRDGSSVNALIKFLSIDYIEKILELDKKIYEGLENKDLYVLSTKDDYLKTLKNIGKVVGCIIPETDELIAMGVYSSYGYDNHNYGYDFNISDEELLKVGQIESTVVDADYRGNGLQMVICGILEDVAKENGNTMISATASPDNKYSVNTFIKLGYEIVADKIKYGGFRRYVLMKKI